MQETEAQGEYSSQLRDERAIFIQDPRPVSTAGHLDRLGKGKRGSSLRAARVDHKFFGRRRHVGSPPTVAGRFIWSDGSESLAGEGVA